jgi:HSP20 family protein
MTLIRWKPIRDVSRWSPASDLATEFFSMQREIDRMFDRFRDGASVEDSGAYIRPHVDIVEEDVRYLVTMELPGVEKKDVKITVAGDVLTVRGEKKQKTEAKEDGIRRFERTYGSFERSFNLPQTVKSDGIDAEFHDGVLTIAIPKAEEAVPKQIDVRIK